MHDRMHMNDRHLSVAFLRLFFLVLVVGDVEAALTTSVGYQCGSIGPPPTPLCTFESGDTLVRFATGSDISGDLIIKAQATPSGLLNTTATLGYKFLTGRVDAYSFWLDTEYVVPPSGMFDFHIDAGEVFLLEGGGTGTAFAELLISVFFNDELVWDEELKVQRESGKAFEVIRQGIMELPVLDKTPPSEVDYSRLFSIPGGDFSANLSRVRTYQPGDVGKLAYSMQAAVYNPGGERAGRARIGDPFSATPVTAPPTWVLLCIGFVWLSIRARPV